MRRARARSPFQHHDLRPVPLRELQRLLGRRRLGHDDESLARLEKPRDQLADRRLILDDHDCNSRDSPAGFVKLHPSTIATGPHNVNE